MYSGVLKTKHFAPHLLGGSVSFAQVLKENPYRDAKGQYTSKEKANYQQQIAGDMVKAFGNKLNGQGKVLAAAYLETKDGKKAIADLATALFKESKHAIAAGGQSSDSLKYMLDSHVDHGYHEMLGDKIKGSLNSKKAWESIYKKKSLAALEKEYPDLLEAAFDAKGADVAKTGLKVKQKVEFWTNQYTANGGDPQEFKDKLTDALDKAVLKQNAKVNAGYADKMAEAEEKAFAESDAGKIAAAVNAQIKANENLTTDPPKASSTPTPPKVAEAPPTTPARPSVPKWTSPTDKASALFENDSLGVHYYKTVGKHGKQSVQATKAYDEWQKSKDFLKKNSPGIDIPKLSSLQKQKAAAAQSDDAAAANKAKYAAQQAEAAAKAQVQSTKDQLQSAATLMHTMAETNPDSPAYQQAVEAVANYKAKALKLGLDSKDIDAAYADGIKSAKTKLAAQKKHAAMLNDAKATIAYYDKNASKFTKAMGDAYNEHQSKQAAALTYGERTALKNYSGSGYTTQNKTSAGVAGYNDKSVDHLASALAKSTLGKDVKLRRNMAQKWFWESFGISNFQNMSEDTAQSVVGKTYTENAYSSTSKKDTFSQAFSGTSNVSGAIALKIRAHKGIRGIDLNTTSISSHDGEKEVLLDKGVTYVIRSVKPVVGSGKIKYEVEVDALGHA